MINKICISAILCGMSVISSVDVSGQIQRRRGSQLPDKIEATASVSEKKAASTAKPQSTGNSKRKKSTNVKKGSGTKIEGASYVISFEGDDKIYTDILNDVTVGDALVVLGECEPFVHPVTGEKIAREENVLGYVIVDEIFTSYMKCRATDDSALDSSSVGARISKAPQLPESAVPSDLHQKEEMAAQQTQNQLFQEMLAFEQAKLPLKTQLVIIDPYTIEGNILYRNVVYKKKKLFEKEKKNQSKVLTPKALKELSESPFYMMAQKAGYKVVFRFYNPDKTDFFAIHLPLRF